VEMIENLIMRTFLIIIASSSFGKPLRFASMTKVGL